LFICLLWSVVDITVAVLIVVSDLILLAIKHSPASLEVIVNEKLSVLEIWFLFFEKVKSSEI